MVDGFPPTVASYSSALPSCGEALACARRGWPVFPCSPDDKRPLVGESAPGPTCNGAQIRAWWQRWPDAMIAAVAGAPIGAFVVDLDPKGGMAAEALLEQLLLRCGGKLPPCPMAHTPRGGLHLYCAMPTGVEIGNRQHHHLAEILERNRRIMLSVCGQLQSERGVIHIVAR
jgi:putative DNA primase/helicase